MEIIQICDFCFVFNIEIELCMCFMTRFISTDEILISSVISF